MPSLIRPKSHSLAIVARFCFWLVRRTRFRAITLHFQEFIRSCRKLWRWPSPKA